MEETKWGEGMKHVVEDRMNQIRVIEVIYGQQIDEKINIKALNMLCSGVRSTKNRITLRKTNLIAIIRIIINST